MKRTVALVLLTLTLWSSAAFAMGSSNQRGVVLFFHQDKVVLKTDNTTLEDIADAIERLSGIDIIVDDVLLYKKISVELTKRDIEGIIATIVRKVPRARYAKILNNEEERKLTRIIIFQKSQNADEIAKEFFSTKLGQQEAFRVKHKATRISGKLSISGTFKLNGIVAYSLPREINKFANFFLAENKVLLNIGDVKLKRYRSGEDFIDFKQYYKDVLVDNLRSYALQIRYLEKVDGGYIMISNNTIPNIKELSVQPKVTKAEATELVLKEIRKLEKNSKLYTKEEVIPESIELKILPQLDLETSTIIEKFGTLSLYWSVKIDFYSYYVDAKTGKVSKEKSL